MEILKWFNPTRWLMLLGLCFALIAGYFTWEHNIRADEKTKVDKVWKAALDKQKLEAAKDLADALAGKGAAETALRVFKDNQEVIDGKAKQVVAGYKNTIADLLNRNGGRLSDPNAETRCGSGGSSPASGNPPGSGNSPDNTSQTGGLLSEALSRLLQESYSEADEINIAYASCRADGMNIRVQFKKLLELHNTTGETVSK